MIDFAKITVKAGDGGRGSGSRAAISRKQYGKADGGDGGSGGDLIFEATNDARGLEPYRFEHFFKAKDGQMGFSNLRRGASASDLILKVPVGTYIRGESAISEVEGNKSTEVTTNYFEFDLVEPGQQALVARGGRGGKGNAHLRDEFGRRPRSGEAGEVGETWELTLELKLIADVGLIGMPNAGKSTLLAKLTAAQPKIANYPFTTLEPNLGVFEEGQLGDWAGGLVGKKEPNDLIAQKPKRLVMADIPGLIEGASEGKGLGDMFLRHIERTKILVHVLDMSRSSQLTVDSSQKIKKDSKEAVNGEPSTDNLLWEDYQTIRQELKKYSQELAKKREIVVLNKCDLLDEEQIAQAAGVFKSHRKKVLVISADKGLGLDILTAEILKQLK